NDHIRVKSITMTPKYLDGHRIIDIRTPLLIDFEFWYRSAREVELAAHILLYTGMDECVFEVNSAASEFNPGLIKGSCTIPGNFLNYGSYRITLIFVKNTTDTLFDFEECLSFDVEDYRENTAWYGDWPGAVRPKFKVDLYQEESVSS